MNPIYVSIVVVLVILLITLMYVKKKKKLDFYRLTLEKLSLSLEDDGYKTTDAYKARIEKIDKVGIKEAIVNHMDEMDDMVASSLKVDKSLFLNSYLTKVRDDHMRTYAIVHGKEEEFDNIE